MKKRLLALLLAATMVFTTGDGIMAATGNAKTKTETETAAMDAASIMADITVGWNLGNSMDSYYSKYTPGEDAHTTDETLWGNPKVTKELLTYVKGQGFNAVRIPVTWYMNSGRDANGHLVVGKKWLARVKEIVDYAISNDMYVVLDSHHDMSLFKIGVTDSAKYASIKCDLGDLWTQVAAEFKDYDNHLMFESFNEIYSANDKWQDPNRCDDTAMAQYNELIQIFVDKVRAAGGNNAKRVLVLGCPLDGSNQYILSRINRPKDDAKNCLMYDAHLYTRSSDQSLEYKLQDYDEFTKRTGMPVIIGETGSTTKFAPAEYREATASNVVSRAKAHNVNIFVWDNGSDYAIINRKDLNSSNSAMINAYMKGLKLTNGYNNPNLVVLDGSNQWVFKKVDKDTGDVVTHNGWGFMTCIDNNGNGIKIPSGMKYVQASLSRRNDAWEVEYASLAFYDANGKFISSKHAKASSFNIEVPSNAVYMKPTIYNAYHYDKVETFNKYFSDGNLHVLISFKEQTPIQETHKHTYVKKIVEPTYFEKGYTINECECGESFTDNETEALTLGKAKLTKVKAIGKKRIKVFFRKVSAAEGFTARYSIEISTNKKFKKNVKTYMASKNTKVIKNLKKKKTYYVRVRAYVKNADGLVAYGKYSRTLKIKVK